MQQLSLEPGYTSSVSAALVAAAEQPELPGTSSSKRRALGRAAAASSAIDSDDQEQDENCTVCWSAAACVVFQPCGHLCCCQACAQPFVSAEAVCPMCRGPVAAGITI